MATPKQRLALAICDFLTKSTTDGTVPSEDAESIEVAVNCIADSFKVDASAASASEPLLSIFTAHEASRPSPAAGAGSATPGAAPTAEQKKEAEALKSRGNAAMAAKDYPKAIELYTEALALHPGNAVFLSNRAAAHSAAKDHESARSDAEAAVDADPSYTKAWSRLGLARFALGDAKGSMEAYGKGIEHEGNGGSEAMKKGYETARRRVEGEGGDLSPQARGSPSPGAPGGMPDFGGLASMLGGGAGGAGGAGGMDFASIMSNPMFQNMAQGLMSNPDMMASLMSNPRLREMANQMGAGGGGGMPDLSSLMSDPNIAELARTMMGGAGAPPGGNSGAGGNPGGN